ncbi:MAG: hypothetical protein HZY76_00555 [Anaerolineae bacterium]|nr:MAG: hypothetical protein HZY76_00555 [Anaerolineae bacterium]
MQQLGEPRRFGCCALPGPAGFVSESDTLRGWVCGSIVEDAPVLGIALSEAQDGMVWVLVNPQ